jgi:hypothetical protein
MLKAEGPKEPTAHKEAMKVPYPKQGSLFSTSQPLCVGDFFPGSYIVRKPADNGESKKDPFKPGGSIPHKLCGGIEYIVEPLPVLNERKIKSSEKEKAPFIPLGVKKGDFFDAKFDYMSPEIVKTVSKTVACNDGHKPVFKVASGCSTIPALPGNSLPIIPQEEKTAFNSKEEESVKALFRPGGGYIPSSYPEYMSSAERFVDRLPRKSSIEKPSWKSGSPDLISSPIPSISFLNLFRHPA